MEDKKNKNKKSSKIAAIDDMSRVKVKIQIKKENVRKSKQKKKAKQPKISIS